METLQFRYSECWIWPGSSRIDQYLNRTVRIINWRIFLAAAMLILYIVVMVFIAGGESYESLLGRVIRFIMIPALILAVTLHEHRRGMAETRNWFTYAEPEQFRNGSMILKADSVCLMLGDKTLEIFYRDIKKLDCRRLERGWRRGFLRFAVSGLCCSEGKGCKVRMKTLQCGNGKGMENACMDKSCCVFVWKIHKKCKILE